tara:strand:+ start:169 stop:753 length:585 start_codon:yes stop_codon:yes gene_type:complete
MTKSIDFYFDFISPYSYLAYKKIKNLNRDNEINVNYKPILLGGLHKLCEITPPAFNKLKMKNMRNDCELVAIKNGIDFKWNSRFPINSLYLMRGYLVIKNDLKKMFIDLCFDAYWKDNRDIANDKDVSNILEKSGLKKDEFFENIKSLKIKNELIELTNNAFKKNIFGAPTFVVNDKIFWGQDRLGYALDEYKN